MSAQGEGVRLGGVSTQGMCVCLGVSAWGVAGCLPRGEVHLPPLWTTVADGNKIGLKSRTVKRILFKNLVDVKLKRQRRLKISVPRSTI